MYSRCQVKIEIYNKIYNNEITVSRKIEIYNKMYNNELTVSCKIEMYNNELTVSSKIEISSKYQVYNVQEAEALIIFDFKI